MKCDICAAPATLQATIEGAQLTVCGSCARSAKDARPLPRPRVTKQPRLRPSHTEIRSKKITVIVSDYAKGTITKNLMEKLIKLCMEKKKIVVVDPKPNHKEFYKYATLISPNHKEAHKMTGFADDEDSKGDVEKMGKFLLEDLKSNVLITRGEKGMSLFEKNGKITHIPTFAKEVFDIVGAGDTSVATLTLALAADASFEEAAIIANHAAGITVGKVGTSTVSIEELKMSIENG